MTSMRIRLGILCLLAGVLAGCGGHPDAGTTSPTRPRWTRIDVPTSLLPDKVLPSINDTAPARGRLPMLYVGSVAEPGAPSRAAAWLPHDNSLGHPVLLGPAGASDAYQVLESATTTYVLGSTWSDGAWSPMLVRSPDRRHWSQVQIASSTTAGSDIDTAVVIGDRVVGLDADATAGVSAIDLESGERTKIDLPTDFTAEDALAEPGGDGAITLLSGHDADGSTSVLAIRSTNGQRWSKPVRLTGQDTSVTGVVDSGEAYVATGERFDRTRYIPAAWVSRDGIHWREEDPPVVNQDAGWSGYAAAPVAAGVDRGGVMAPVVSYEDRSTAVAEYCGRCRRGHRWFLWVGIPDGASAGADAIVTTDGYDLAVVRSDLHTVEVGTWERTGSWHSRSTTAEDIPIDGWQRAVPADGHALLVGAQVRYRTFANGYWQRLLTPTAYAVRGDRLTAVPWRPRPLGATAEVLRAEGHGAAVQAGTVLHLSRAGHDESDIVAWARTAKGWVPATGLRGMRSEAAVDLTATKEGFVIVGSDGADRSGGHEHGAVWTSPDGTRWQRRTGDFDPDPGRDSWLNTACDLPGRGLVVLGSETSAPAGSRPIALEPHDGRFERTSLDGIGHDTTSYYDCVSTSRAALVMTSGGDRSLWVTHDGSHFAPAGIGTRTEAIADVIGLDGGFAAVGTVTSGRTDQATLWLSRDGVDWHAYPMPTDRPASPSAVTVDGDRLVVAMTSDSGPIVLRLDDPSDLLAGS